MTAPARDPFTEALDAVVAETRLQLGAASDGALGAALAEMQPAERNLAELAFAAGVRCTVAILIERELLDFLALSASFRSA